MWASCDADIRVKIEALETENGFGLDQKTFCCFSVDPTSAGERPEWSGVEVGV
jgi:hypothetical protein